MTYCKLQVFLYITQRINSSCRVRQRSGTADANQYCPWGAQMGGQVALHAATRGNVSDGEGEEVLVLREDHFDAVI